MRRGLIVVLAVFAGCSFEVAGPAPARLDAAVVDAGSTDAPPLVVDAPACDPSFLLTIGTSRYYVGQNMNYDDSQAYCVSKGARLAIIESASEDTALAALLAT